VSLTDWFHSPMPAPLPPAEILAMRLRSRPPIVMKSPPTNSASLSES